MLIFTGNHDITLDDQFYAKHSSQFHNQYPQNSQRCIYLCKNHPSIIYLNHEAIDIQLAKDDGPRTKFKVFGSPYSPADGLWAFGYRPEEASRLWKQIPLDTDIVVTHTPPKHHCDKSNTRDIAGCETLRQMLWWVRPHLVVCGHIHDGRGAERVMWNLTSPDRICEESGVRYWEDPGHNNKKQSLLNLSANGDFPLANTMYNESTSSRDAVDSQRIVQKSMSMVPWIYKSEATS